MGERYLDAVEVGGSIPPVPTIFLRQKMAKEIEIKCQGKTGHFPVGITVKEALLALTNLAEDKLIAAKINGKPVDLSYTLMQSVTLEPITSENSLGLEILRHSTAHVMAEAVKHLYPEAKVTIGPAIENGFYYDFDYPPGFTPEALEKIEQEMKKIISQDEQFQRQEISKKEAQELFQSLNETYKLEILKEIPEEKVSIYKNGDFIDLCRGPHIESTGKIKTFKLLSVAGAYWRGDERNPMLQRIYGTAFFNKKDLDKYLKQLEEAKKRDHRRLGRELDLFIQFEEIGAGFPVYLPKGAILRHILEEFEIKEHLKRGYQMVIGPQLLKGKLWERSGHMEYYKENMYFTEIEGQLYGIKPMNCLAHIMIYQSQIRSYRDLPIRYFELGTVCRHEKSGVLHGMLRVRQFTQDDAHIFCTPDQLNVEIKKVLDFVDDVMGIFGFSYEVELSTRPQKSIGSDEIWEHATQALIQALQDKGFEYHICKGEGAFYGPKIDIKLKDALGRKWQCATIQCDFALPERFELSYIDTDGQKKRPAMLHRVILGTLERFIGVLTEHFSGAFPPWLAPVQVKILTVTDRNVAYGQKIYELLSENGFRIETDFRNEKLGYKIREAQLQKIPFMLVIGDKEVKTNSVTPRRRTGENLGSMSLEVFVNLLKEETAIPKPRNKRR
ncbi:threonyl-tRNA synthetase [Candidatus Desulfofervidus auxilii]|uniref:Threonine--tRNA ligase n=2 Tax=Desulfofervidus auxilii TaxID=1621989 RepID=A0A7U4TI82_DESA2|nr:threonyl-tRNA synthetase [Candidatus Desulfofervidus auxilii]